MQGLLLGEGLLVEAFELRSVTKVHTPSRHVITAHHHPSETSIDNDIDTRTTNQALGDRSSQKQTASPVQICPFLDPETLQEQRQTTIKLLLYLGKSNVHLNINST